MRTRGCIVFCAFDQCLEQPSHTYSEFETAFNWKITSALYKLGVLLCFAHKCGLENARYEVYQPFAYSPIILDSG
ncbi:MAG: hypothetical protein COA52_11110 [Hyphomicrobiales bacterium]|nr:MAG: hypothetical protein COA52_11110 [Hyphomicrobiales bacterium]